MHIMHFEKVSHGELLQYFKLSCYEGYHEIGLAYYRVYYGSIIIVFQEKTGQLYVS